jgi:hypothetical protein
MGRSAPHGNGSRRWWPGWTARYRRDCRTRNWEEQLQVDGRQLLRQLLQDHLDVRAQREQRLVDVADAAGVEHPYAESGHTSSLATVFGQVSVARIAYRTLDWYCCPRFDSPSVFAALLDADHGGPVPYLARRRPLELKQSTTKRTCPRTTRIRRTTRWRCAVPPVLGGGGMKFFTSATPSGIRKRVVCLRHGQPSWSSAQSQDISRWTTRPDGPKCMYRRWNKRWQSDERATGPRAGIGAVRDRTAAPYGRGSRSAFAGGCTRPRGR